MAGMKIFHALTVMETGLNTLYLSVPLKVMERLLLQGDPQDVRHVQAQIAAPIIRMER